MLITYFIKLKILTKLLFSIKSHNIHRWIKVIEVFFFNRNLSQNQNKTKKSIVYIMSLFKYSVYMYLMNGTYLFFVWVNLDET